MKKLLIATCVIMLMLTLSFTTNPKTETALAAKACDFCSYIECGKSYIEIQENGWWLPKICHNYVAIGYEGCSMHGGRSCDAAEN